MFKITEIRELIRLLDETSISELQLESAGTKLLIKKPDGSVQSGGVHVAPAPMIHTLHSAPVHTIAQVPASQAVETKPEPKATVVQTDTSADLLNDASLVKIVSPMVGTFYAAPSPEAKNYVQVGDQVNEKTVVCIVEAMKLMNEIEADVRGSIVAILVENGHLVEYGQPMFLVKPE